jgi:hypothetical protein
VSAPRKYPDELRARAVRLYRESDPKPVIRRLAEQLGVNELGSDGTDSTPSTEPGSALAGNQTPNATGQCV